MTIAIQRVKLLSIVALFLAAAVVAWPPIAKYQGYAFTQPSLGEDLGYPTNDCGKNYHLVFRYVDPSGDQQECIVGKVDQKTVQDRANALKRLNSTKPGELREMSWIEIVLHELAAKWIPGGL